ncbi:MAG: ROK family protein [Vibrio sp.]
MYMAQPGHIDQIKQINTGRVYKLIDQFGPISRIDLSKLSGLAPASITKISRELMEGHLIHEAVVQESLARGRPAVGLQTNNVGWQFLSIRLGKGYLIIALHELGGEMLVDHKIDIEAANQEELQQKILDEIEHFFITYTSYVERITSIALTLPALVNYKEGVVIRMPYFNIENLPLGPAIYEKTGVPVFIAHDTCAWVLAEQLFGQAQEVSNALLLSNHQGVTAGVILNNRLVYNRNGTIGNLGHLQVDPNGKQCVCGQRGCLDTIASSQAVCEKVKYEIEQGQETTLSLENVTMERICAAAMGGDDFSRQTIEQLGKDLAKGIVTMVNIFGPEKILIGGALTKAKPILFPAITEALNQCGNRIFGQDLPLVECKFYTQTTVPGAALIKQALYDGSLLMKVVEG